MLKTIKTFENEERRALSTFTICLQHYWESCSWIDERSNGGSIKMKKYFVKSHFRGWVEVPKESYERYKNNILEHSTPPSCTPKELVERLTKIVEE